MIVSLKMPKCPLWKTLEENDALQNVPENIEKLREKEYLEMRISTKPFYKLFSVVHNYFLWMFLIIERIYDDRISSKCPRKLRKFPKIWKTENVNIY